MNVKFPHLFRLYKYLICQIVKNIFSLSLQWDRYINLIFLKSDYKLVENEQIIPSLEKVIVVTGC